MPNAKAETLEPPSDAEASPDDEDDRDDRDDRAMPRWIKKAIALWYVGAFVAIAIFLLLRRLQDLILWFLFALFLSFAIEPGVNALTRRGWRRSAATALIVFAALVTLILFVALMVPVIVEQAEQLADRAPAWLAQANEFTEERFGISLNADTVLGFIRTARADLAGAAAQVAHAGGLVLGVLVEVLTIALFTYYLVADGPRFRRTICSYLPARRQREVLSTWEIAIDKTGGYLYSRLLLAAISSVATFIALQILDIPFPLPLALWMGFVSQFIPVIGTYLAASVPLLVALLEDPWSALMFLIFVVVYQQIENYILAPRITARTMQLHPAVAYAAALAGAWIGGLVGALIALPAVAVVQAVVSTYLQRHEVVETELTQDGSGEGGRREEGERSDR